MVAGGLTLLPGEDGAIDPRVVAGKCSGSIIDSGGGLDFEAVSNISSRGVVAVHDVDCGP